MLYEKSAFGQRYIRLLTGSWVWFIAFVLSGMAVFLALAHATKLEVIRTYPVREAGQDRLVISYTGEAPSKAYLYARRNEGVYPVRIERTEAIGDGYALYLDRESTDVAVSLSEEGSRSLCLDIPQGTETLLHRILLKGGKSVE